MKVLVGILLVIVGALIWSLYALQDARKSVAAALSSNEVVILDFSNRWDRTRKILEEQMKVNSSLETNLDVRAQQLNSLRAEIAALQEDLAHSRAETKSAQDEIAKRDAQISSLEGRNVDLTQQMGDLQAAIAALEKQIAEAERQLAAAEGNRQELLEELSRLQNEKIELERQLTDLSFLRDQVRKLKEELTIARRLEWIRRGIYAPTTRKGAEVLTEMKFGNRPAGGSESTAQAGPSLDVEIRRTGEVTINAPTNAPAPSP
jgi:predicted  nucleic acid-binding Zn-ribbon protein